MLMNSVVAVIVLGFFAHVTAEAASAGGIKRIRNRGGNNRSTSDNYDAGSGDSVKSIKPNDLDNIKEKGMPLLLYIYDSESSGNETAKHLEKLLSNKEVEQLSLKFSKVKIKQNGSDAKGWPEKWRMRAKNGAALFVVASDKTRIIVFDKQLGRDSITVEGIRSALNGVLKYEDTNIKK